MSSLIRSAGCRRRRFPVALNLFSAVCAALTLGLLARSVAILPHDRTDAQREREHSDFSFLTIRQRVAAAGFGRGGLRFANDVLGAGDELHAAKCSTCCCSRS